MEILRGLRSAYEEHHGVAICDEALDAAARLSDRYVSEYHLPDKAIDLIDQAAARCSLAAADRAPGPLRCARRSSGCAAEKQAAVDAEAYEDAGRIKERIDELEAAAVAAAPEDDEPGGTVVGEPDVADVVAARTGIPVGELVAGELQRLGTLEDDLHRARDRPGRRPSRWSPRPSATRRAGLAEPDRAAGEVPVHGPDGRRQDRARQGARASGCSRPRRRSSESTCPSIASRTLSPD